MSFYGPGGYEDDDDDDEFDFGDHYDPEYSSDSFYPASAASKYTHNGPNETADQTQKHQMANTSLGKSVSHGGFGSPSDLSSSLKGKSAGRGRGRGGLAPPNTQKNFQSKKDGKNSKKNKGQGNLLFSRTKDKMLKNNEDEKRHSQLVEDFRAVIVNGDVAMIQNMLDKGISVDCILKSGWTGLMLAANYGLPEVVNVLVERGANVNFQKDMFSVIMAACSSDCDKEDKVAECLSTLIEKGGHVNSHDRYHMTPLMFACRNGREKMVEILLRHKPNVNKQDQRGWTALGWAASRGHGRIVRMLLDENATPKLYTNDGQSAEDLAYDGGFTIIADVLNSIVNPSRRMEQNPENVQESGLSSEQGNCVRYGDLELFLFGLELGHLVPLFQGHKITFDGFLQLTDAELQQIGVSEVGIRKKILEATHDVHTKQWDLSSLPSQSTINQFTSDDFNLVLANVEKHLHYIKCSVGYVTKRLSGMADATSAVQDAEHARQFLGKAEDVLTEVNGLSDEISRLQCSVREISSTVPNAPADLICKETNLNEKHKFAYLPVALVGGCLALGLTMVWLNRGTKT